MKTKSKKVLVMGAFDVLHKGHLSLFEQAAKLGDEVHVIVGRDKTIEKVKGEKPWDSEEERLRKVGEAPFVTKAHLGRLDDKFLTVKDHDPDLICLGYDQMDEKMLAEKLKKRGIECPIVRLKPFEPHKYKSTIIKQGMKDKIDK